MKAMTIARFMLALTRDAGWEKMDQLKLNKLLYIAQGKALAQTGEPLFDDPIVAFKNGPVVMEVEEHYRGTRGGIDSTDNLDDIAVDDERASIIVAVLAEYKNKTAIGLTRLVHRPENPWTKAYEQGNRTTIKRDDIKAFYSEQYKNKPSLSSLIEKMARVEIHAEINEAGHIVLPASERENDEYDMLEETC